MAAALDYALGLFDRAKARVFSEAGKFLQNRDRILTMRDVADAMERKGETAGRPEFRDLAHRLRVQLDRLYDNQVVLEGRVQIAAAAFAAPSAGQSALGIAQMAAAAAPLLRDVAVHVAKVKAAKKATDALKARTLTPGELAAIGRAGGFGALTFAGLAVVGVSAFLLLRGRGRSK